MHPLLLIWHLELRFTVWSDISSSIKIKYQTRSSLSIAPNCVVVLCTKLSHLLKAQASVSLISKVGIIPAVFPSHKDVIKCLK